jgi:CubicO group peptidase (beta-lactamase class C family)
MKTRPTTILLTLALLFPAFAAAQHFPSNEDLTTLIQTRIEEGRATGIVLGVLEADGTTRIVWSGEAGPEAKPLGTRSVFEIGSITKVFTGILLADMVAKGEVAYSDPVSKYLPDSATMPTRDGQEITLLDLAVHHSGLPRMPSNFAPADPTNPFADYTPELMFEFLSGHELERDIGASYEYSNIGVGLLGYVLAGVAGGSYEEVIRERILMPLGMSMSGITLEGELAEWMANGHDQQGNIVPLWDIPTLAGAGAIRSDVGDMLTFLAANTGEPQSDLEKAMRESHTLREEISEQMGVGLNWHIRKVGEESVVWHNGGTAGFRTFAGFDPRTGVGAVVLTNSGHGADDIGFHLINAGVPLTPKPEEYTEIEVSGEILATYVGEYELRPGLSIAVTMEDGALFIQPTGQNVAPIYPATETRFFLKVVDAQISFTRDESGAVAGIVLHQGGNDLPGRRVTAEEVPDS